MFNFRVTVEGTRLRTETKFVFLTQLLLLFKFCYHCKTDNPVVETMRVGTAVVVTTTCSNAKCGRKNVWRCEPFMPGTKAYAGNVLLCFAIYSVYQLLCIPVIIYYFLHLDIHNRIAIYLHLHLKSIKFDF